MSLINYQKFRGVIEEYCRRIRAGVEQEEFSIEKLGRIVEVTYDLYQAHPSEIRFTLLSQYNFWDLLEDEIKPHFIFRRILEVGMEKGEIPRQEVYFWITVFTGVMLQPLAQYPYFSDVLPAFTELKKRVTDMVRKLFS